MGTQRSTARGQSVIVISPLGNLAVLDPNNRNTLHGDFHGSFEAAEEGLGRSKSESPFGDHPVTTDEDRVGLQQTVGIKFSCLVEEFSQPLFVLKLQPYPVVFELELLGKGGERFFDFAALQLRQNRQHNCFQSRLWNQSLSYRCVFLHFVLPMILASRYFRSALAALIRPSRMSRLYLY